MEPNGHESQKQLGTTGEYRERLMEYGWVNQNQTYQFEAPGGYMWSPKASTNGARNQFCDNMTETRPGDVDFSFKDTYVRAVGIVIGRAETVAKLTEFKLCRESVRAGGTVCTCLGY